MFSLIDIIEVLFYLHINIYTYSLIKVFGVYDLHNIPPKFRNGNSDSIVCCRVVWSKYHGFSWLLQMKMSRCPMTNSISLTCEIKKDCWVLLVKLWCWDSDFLNEKNVVFDQYIVSATNILPFWLMISWLLVDVIPGKVSILQLKF